MEREIIKSKSCIVRDMHVQQLVVIAFFLTVSQFNLIEQQTLVIRLNYLKKKERKEEIRTVNTFFRYSLETKYIRNYVNRKGAM